MKISNNNLTGTINEFIKILPALEELDISNNYLEGTIPEYLPITLHTLFVHNNNFNGSLPSIFKTLPLKSIDISNTRMCGSFPEEWKNINWISCNLDIPHYCYPDLPAQCRASPCDETLNCYSYPCEDGSHRCHDKRECIANDNWGYTCGPCDSPYLDQGPYDCDDVLLIKIPILCILFLALILGIIFFLRRKKIIELKLPVHFNWLWNSVYIRQNNYQKINSNTTSYSREVKPDSNEDQLLSDLKNKLDFGDILIHKAYAVSCITLAQNFRNTLQIQIERISTKPSLFFQQKWLYSEDAALRSKTIKHYHDTVQSWPWNQEEDSKSPILAVVHGTDIETAWAVASSGFANLGLLDDGFFGKGMYFSSSATYTLPYFSCKQNPCVIICLVLTGNPYPVIEAPKDPNSFKGKALTSSYQSHYVVTTSAGAPFKDRDYANNMRQFNEIVLAQESQILPIFLLEIDKSNFPVLTQNYQRIMKKSKVVASTEGDEMKIPEYSDEDNSEMKEIRTLGIKEF
jgi:hypothetical protein